MANKDLCKESKENKHVELIKVIDEERVQKLLPPLASSLDEDSGIIVNPELKKFKKLYLGLDLGTTNLVAVALNENCEPVGAVMQPSKSSVRDGVVVDYFSALKGMESCLVKLSQKLGRELAGSAATAYPPGINPKTAKVFANIVESLGFECGGLYEEPSVAAETLGVSDGAVVDIGGGTTGISVLRNKEIVYSADEPTGGTHMTLVISGAMGLEFDRAEELKRIKSEQPRLMPMLRPVLEKMGVIVKTHLEKSGYYGRVPVIVSGGGADLPCADEILSGVIGLPVHLTPYPMLVTPAGIAARLWREKNA